LKKSVFKYHLKEDKLKAQLSFHIPFHKTTKGGNNAALSMSPVATCSVIWGHLWWW